LTQKADVAITLTCRGIKSWETTMPGITVCELVQLSENSGESIGDILCVAALAIIAHTNDVPGALIKMAHIHDSSDYRII